MKKLKFSGEGFKNRSVLPCRHQKSAFTPAEIQSICPEGFHIKKETCLPQWGKCPEGTKGNNPLGKNKRGTSRRTAFTLAEVLITLLIIGVIAAITLPAIYHNIQKKVLYTQFMKAVSILNQAAKMYQNDYGYLNPKDLPGITDVDNNFVNYSNNFGEIFSKFFTDATKITDGNAEEICNGYNKIEVRLGYGTDQKLRSNNSSALTWCGTDRGLITNPTAILTKDGMLITFDHDFGVVNGQIVDVNGPSKGPNAFGRDIFLFYFTPYGIVWSGEEEKYKMDYGYGDSVCQPNDGSGCAAKLLREKGMYY